MRSYSNSHYIIMEYQELFLTEQDFDNIQTILKYSSKFSIDSTYTPIDLDIAFQSIDTVENTVLWTVENERLIKEVIIAMEFFNSIKHKIHLSLSYIFNLHLKLILRACNYNIEAINLEIVYLSSKTCNKFGSCVDLSSEILIEFCGSLIEWSSDSLIKDYEFNLIYNSVYSYYDSNRKRQSFKNEKETYESILLKMASGEELSIMELKVLTNAMAKTLYKYFNPLVNNPLINDLVNVLIKMLRLCYPTFKEEDIKLVSTIKSIVTLHKKNIFIYSENLENYIPYRNLFLNINTIEDIKNIEY